MTQPLQPTWLRNAPKASITMLPSHTQPRSSCGWFTQWRNPVSLTAQRPDRICLYSAQMPDKKGNLWIIFQQSNTESCYLVSLTYTDTARWWAVTRHFSFTGGFWMTNITSTLKPNDCPTANSQKKNRQDHLYRPCPFHWKRQGDDGGQNQAHPLRGSTQNATSLWKWLKILDFSFLV